MADVTSTGGTLRVRITMGCPCGAESTFIVEAGAGVPLECVGRSHGCECDERPTVAEAEREAGALFREHDEGVRWDALAGHL